MTQTTDSVPTQCPRQSAKKDQPSVGNLTDNNVGDSNEASTQVIGHRLGYARVSTNDGRQVTDRQIDELKRFVVDQIFTDHASASTLNRPQLQFLLGSARRGDSLVVTSLDRLSRNTQQLLRLVEDLDERGIALVVTQINLDTSSPMGRAILTILGCLAEMERAILIERVKDGLAAAKARGRVGGRPPALSASQRAVVLEMLAAGKPASECAEIVSVSTRTIRRLRATHQADTSPEADV